MRHAQEHWLRLQANAAVQAALRYHVHGDEGQFVDATISSADCEALARSREIAIEDAAMPLIGAELVHREIVRRGGRG